MGLVWVAVLLFGGYSAWRVFADPDPEKRKAYLKTVLTYAGTALLCAVAFRSGMPWLLALIAVAFVAMRWGNSAKRETPEPRESRPPESKKMSRQEALAVLDLEEGASDSEINDRYRMLMRKVHPDQGGSPYLATQLNAARRTLSKR
jgi:DnaJ homolog subfamily C member 19